MKLSAQQLEAMEAVREWSRNKWSGSSQVFYLAGYAGSGKTTLAKEFAKEHGGNVAFGAYTGKAALVLRQKGCEDARTIHNLIYVPTTKSKQHLHDLQHQLADLDEHDPHRIGVERLITEEKLRLKKPSFAMNESSDMEDFDLVIIDEVSMVDEQMGEDLVSFGVPILVLGDPAQLPPVGKSTGYFTKSKPDFVLTEVHRQAEGSPVLQLATRVRKGETLPLGEFGDSSILPPKSLTGEQALEFDQIICGKNVTRKAINKRVRSLLGRDSILPVEGDKLICLRNDKATGLLNGSFWIVIEASILDEDRMNLLVQDADNPAANHLLTAWRHGFEGRELPWFRARDAQEFDFGYAITCHKSQGSQWPRVLIYDQSYMFRKDRNKWLYTALTRASNSVTIVKS